MIQQKNDWLTIAAVGLLAMCVVTFDHEALGHGSACLALHGRILALSSSVFRCSAQSGWIDFGGPAMNLFCGLVALVARWLVPQRFLKLRLFLIAVTAFSFLWEGGYLIHAMHRADGDSYFFLRWWLGAVTVWQRWLCALLGLALYLVTVRFTAKALLGLWPESATARSVARIVWVAATIGATLAALAYSGNINGDLRDAVLEISAASFPLLIIPRRSDKSSSPNAVIARSYLTIALAVAVYAVFVATLGRGLS